MPHDVNQTPEKVTRDRIDDRIRAAGWQVQDKDPLDFNAGLGIARPDLASSPPPPMPSNHLLPGTSTRSNPFSTFSCNTCSPVPRTPCSESAKPGMLHWDRIMQETDDLTLIYSKELHPSVYKSKGVFIRTRVSIIERDSRYTFRPWSPAHDEQFRSREELLRSNLTEIPCRSRISIRKDPAP